MRSKAAPTSGKRLLFEAICVYAPHLLEEHITHMADDPLIVFAFSMFENDSARHASFAVFQIMMMVSLTMTLLFSLGGNPKKIVMGVLAFSLLAEAHHLIRFLISPHYNSGLYTALPMPIVGFLIFRHLFTKEKIPCSTTSSSPWASGESRSVWFRFSPRKRALAFSASPTRTTRRRRV